VGYYPNSTFVHVDVRAASAYWVDRSGPGEKPNYVRARAAGEPEPVRADTTVEAERAAITAQVERALADALDDVHGPELPVADEAPSRDPAVSAREAAPTAEAVVEDAEVERAPAAAASEAASLAEAPAAASATTPADEAEPPTSEAPVDPAELDAEIKSLLDRALVVMQQANAAG
jgi:hypothetical protein